MILSSRWRRPKNADDPHDTFKAADAFHATRLDWIYNFDPDWIRECRNRGFVYGAALNSKLSDAVGSDERREGRIRNRKGELVTAPWMRSWKHWWGCVNSDAFRRSFLEHAECMVAGGADVIHVDDPGINATAVRRGGCFCNACQEKADRAGVDLSDKNAILDARVSARIHERLLSGDA